MCKCGWLVKTNKLETIDHAETDEPTKLVQFTKEKDVAVHLQ